MQRNSILKPASYLFTITIAVALVNFFYNAIMSRMLGVSDFGDLRALFSILMILCIPVSSIQTMITKFTAQYHQANSGKLKNLIIHTLYFLLGLGLIFTFIFWIFQQQIANYLNIASADSVSLLGPIMMLFLLNPLVLGIYQGMQRFVLFGVNILVGTIFKLISSVVFVALGFGVIGILYGQIFSGIFLGLIFGLVIIFLFRKHQAPREGYNKSEIYSYSGYALGVLICFSIISQIDILIVKVKFLPQDAGLYACAAVIGKSFLFLPVPIVTVLFPKVVENRKQGISSLPILIQSLTISALLCAVGVIICFFFPQLLVMIFGVKYAQGAHLFKIFGLSMTPLALFYVLMNYFLSEYRLRFFYFCMFSCILGVALLFVLPTTPHQFLTVLGWYSLLMFLIPLAYILKKGKKFV